MTIETKPYTIVQSKLRKYLITFYWYKSGYYLLNISTFFFALVSALATTLFLAGNGDKQEALPNFLGPNSFFRENFLIITTLLSAFSALFTSLTSVFVMKSRYLRAMKSKDMVSLEIALYQSKQGVYEKSKYPEFKLFKRTLEISSYSKSLVESEGKTKNE